MIQAIGSQMPHRVEEMNQKCFSQMAHALRQYERARAQTPEAPTKSQTLSKAMFGKLPRTDEPVLEQIEERPTRDLDLEVMIAVENNHNLSDLDYSSLHRYAWAMLEGLVRGRPAASEEDLVEEAAQLVGKRISVVREQNAAVSRSNEEKAKRRALAARAAEKEKLRNAARARDQDTRRIRREEREERREKAQYRAREKAMNEGSNTRELRQSQAARKPKAIQINSWQRAEINALAWTRHMGFSDARLTRGGADGGVDISGSKAIAQVKNEGSATGVQAVRQLSGTGRETGAEYVLFFTAHSYTREALRHAEIVGMALFTYDLYGTISAANAHGEHILA